jgi:hypothetical protein
MLGVVVPPSVLSIELRFLNETPGGNQIERAISAFASKSNGCLIDWLSEEPSAQATGTMTAGKGT